MEAIEGEVTVLSVPDNGKVIKAVNALSAETRHGVRPVVVEEIQVFPVHVAVRGIHVTRAENQEGRLVVISDGEVQSLRLHRCDSNKISSCRLVELLVFFLVFGHCVLFWCLASALRCKTRTAPGIRCRASAGRSEAEGGGRRTSSTRALPRDNTRLVLLPSWEKMPDR